MRAKEIKDIFIFLLKWLPAIGTAVISAHYAHVLSGDRTIIIDYIADTSLFSWIFLYIASRLFFCRVHQMLICYIGLASLEIDLRRWTHFTTDPAWLIPAIMMGVGFSLLILAFRRKIHFRGELIRK